MVDFYITCITNFSCIANYLKIKNKKKIKKNFYWDRDCPKYMYIILINHITTF